MVSTTQIFAYLVVIPSDAATWVGWLALCASVLIGLAIAFLLTKLLSVGVFILGFWLGAAVGTLLYNIALKDISDEGSSIILWVTLVILGILGGIVCVRAMEPAIMVSTAFIGAYSFVRGISLFAGNYPNEYDIITGVDTGSYEMPWQFWVYLSAIIVLSILGSIF